MQYSEYYELKWFDCFLKFYKIYRYVISTNEKYALTLQNICNYMQNKIWFIELVRLEI